MLFCKVPIFVQMFMRSVQLKQYFKGYCKCHEKIVDLRFFLGKRHLFRLLNKGKYSLLQITDFAKVHGKNVNNIARNAVVSSKINEEENANMIFFYAL